MKLTINRRQFKTHVTYFVLAYLVAIALVNGAFSVLYGATTPEIPRQYKVDILVAGSVDSSESAQWSRDILDTLTADQQLVQFLVMNITQGDMDDGTIIEAMYARLLTEEGDMLLLPYWLYDLLAPRGFFLRLDQPGEDGQTPLAQLNLPEAIDPSRCEIDYVLEKDEQGQTIRTERSICGIPMDKVLGMWDLGLPPADLVACFPVYTENLDNALASLQWMVDNKMTYTEPAK